MSNGDFEELRREVWREENIFKLVDLKKVNITFVFAATTEQKLFLFVDQKQILYKIVWG